MATLQVRDIDDGLYNFLKRTAKLKNRSLSQEVIHMLQSWLNSSESIKNKATLEFLELSGAWKDDRSAENIIKDLRNKRNNSQRFEDKNGLFD